MLSTMIDFVLKRDLRRFANATAGLLLIAGQEECVTLEDPVREVWDAGAGKWVWSRSFKVAGMTAIPSGRYELVIDMSTRFNRMMPHILDVPDFDGIRIHNGGTVENTDGCPLTGRELHSNNGVPFLTGSKADAFPRFFQKLEAALKMDRVFITIDNGVPS